MCGDKLYTEEDVEAAAKAAAEAHGFVWHGLSSVKRDTWLAAQRAAITAAGGVVADEVVEVDRDEARVRVGDAEGSWLEEFFDGDKLYIVRAKENSE